MTRADYTDVTLLIDCSESMSNKACEAESGIRAFLDKQCSEPGFLLYSQYNFSGSRVTRVVDAIEAGLVSNEYKMHCSGMTPLYLAVVKSIIETGERFDFMKDESRPGCVIFVILTDGLDNNSGMITSNCARKLIREHGDKYNWQFLFLGVDFLSINEALLMGISEEQTSIYDPDTSSAGLAAASSVVIRTRSASINGEDLDIAAEFTSDERSSMV